MGSNPINLFVRFLLELAALFAFGSWAWQQSDALGLKLFFILLAVVIPAALWGTFAVPNDPSRSGKAPVPVPGLVRLLLEWFFFAAAAWALFEAGKSQAGTILAAITLIHYLISYDRIIWLLKQK